jgi:hypothetical protein
VLPCKPLSSPRYAGNEVPGHSSYCAHSRRRENLPNNVFKYGGVQKINHETTLLDSKRMTTSFIMRKMHA